MPERKDKKEEAALNFKVSVDVHEKLRHISFDKRISISELCREGVQLIIKKYEKST